jgi:glycyl-tRNA synthetase beta subunit
MPDLLFEIGTEELPAGFIEPALSFMKTSIEKSFVGECLGFKDV